MRNMWEEPIIKMTGGFTSEQVLNGEMETAEEISEVLPDPETLDDSALEETEAVPTEENTGVSAWSNPDFSTQTSNN